MRRRRCLLLLLLLPFELSLTIGEPFCFEDPKRIRCKPHIMSQFIALVLALSAGAVTPHTTRWQHLAPGMALGSLDAKTPSPVGDSKIIVVRIDPARWKLDLIGRSSTGDTAGQTAREWADAHDLAVAINAGMFGSDSKTHVGFMQCRGHVYSRRVNSYQSVAAFDPRIPENPPFRIFDLDEPGITMQTIRQDYTSVVQNLRLIKRPGNNRWSQQDKRWSEAALGEDKDGRILLIFSRSPFTMHDLNRELISADIGLTALQHLEGGPEAQLYLKVDELELELFGSYETSFRENDGNSAPWPIPNVLGIRRRSVAD